MMKAQIETLYKLKDKIEYEKEKANPRSYEWAELDKELAALCCAIFELENQQTYYLVGQVGGSDIIMYAIGFLIPYVIVGLIIYAIIRG